MSQEKKVIDKKLGEILIARGLITTQQLEEALALQQKEEGAGLIGEVLVKLKYVTEEAIAWALTVQYGFPYLPLSSYEIDRDVIQVIPHEFAKRHGVIGIDKSGTVLTIAMSNPLNHEVIEELETTTKCKVQIFISTLTEVHEMISKYYAQAKA